MIEGEPMEKTDGEELSVGLGFHICVEFSASKRGCGGLYRWT